METKFNLHLCANYSQEKLKSAICNCILTDYIIEKLKQTIKKFNNEDIDLFYVYKDFETAIEKGNSVSFAGIEGWESNKTSVFQDVFKIVVTLDDILAKAELIESGSLIEEFRNDTLSYQTLLYLCDITCDSVDLGMVEVRPEYIDNLKSQLTFIDEGQFLSDIADMKTESVLLDTYIERHKYIEQRLVKAQKVANAVKDSLEKEFDKLHDDVMYCYGKFHKIAYSSLSDAEKASVAKDVCNITLAHKKILDKLENKLTVANELKRQLFINEKKIRQDMPDRLAEYEAKLQEKPYEKMDIDRQKQAYLFVNNEYLEKINVTIDLVNSVAQDISDRFDMIDRIDASLRSAIPSESEMKRYSALTFKYEDLYVRLALAKSQIKNKDKDFEVALKGAMLGLKVLSHLASETKELFIRNSLLSMVFNCVNGIYDLVDTKNKSLELSQIKFVTSRLVKYSLLNNNFVTDLRTFRHICNNLIRDVAIMMGKPFNLQTMVEINETIELGIQQVEDLINTINTNHIEQSNLLGDILNVN